MDLTGKIDVLDMIIDVLKDHERSFDAKLFRLETLINSLERR